LLLLLLLFPRLPSGNGALARRHPCRLRLRRLAALLLPFSRPPLGDGALARRLRLLARVGYGAFGRDCYPLGALFSPRADCGRSRP
jgi:hypothetical protein